MDNLTLKQELNILKSQLINERQSFISQWKDLAEYILPSRPRWFLNQTNRGDRRNTKIINARASLAVRTAKAGMMGGISNPARRWFNLDLSTSMFENSYPVKYWLYSLTKELEQFHLRTNLYNILPVIYGDILTFATGTMGIEEDLEEKRLRYFDLPIGSYAVASSDKDNINVIWREFRLTVRQIISKFGERDKGKIKWDNFTRRIKELYDRKQFDAWIDVDHFIMPNPDYDPNNPFSVKFQSIYLEQNQNSFEEVYLRKSGYMYFPILCARWSKISDDVYGTDCPGMFAIGHVKALQLMEKRLAQALDKKVHPPLIAPTYLKTQKISSLMGDITWADEREGQKGIRPVHTVDMKLDELNNKIEKIESDISRYFFEDLFLMITNLDRREITAREIDERREEKLFALGDVLNQLNKDLFDPLTDITVDFMARNNMIMPPPEEIQGMPMKVEYISIMAQAQKLLGLIGIERFSNFFKDLINQTQKLDLLDKINFDELINVYGDMSGIPIGIIRPDEIVNNIRTGRQKALIEQQQAESQDKQMSGVGQGAEALKTLSQTKMEGDSILNAIVEQAKNSPGKV